MKKGFVMTIDAVFAVMLVLLALTLVYTLNYFSISINTERTNIEQIHMKSEDALQVLNNKGVLEKIVDYWANSDLNSANKTARRYLDEIIPENMGYRLEIGGDNISINDKVKKEVDATDKMKSTRLISNESNIIMVNLIVWL
ncbi:MAG: hypothetical protein DRO92_03880 [Candidatus Altiarchaeales archaeon]|nr:MAG: hypothetical protein DRO92_03880 [Candidatus Altiarchaeales archaeon]